MTNENKFELIEQEVEPFIRVLFEEMKKIDNFFGSRKILIISLSAENIEHSVEYSEFEVPLLTNRMKTEIPAISLFRLKFQWNAFSRVYNNKGGRSYSIMFQIHVPLNKPSWTISDDIQTTLTGMTIKSFCGKPNQEKAKEFANKILKKFMTFVKS